MQKPGSEHKSPYHQLKSFIFNSGCFRLYCYSLIMTIGMTLLLTSCRNNNEQPNQDQANSGDTDSATGDIDGDSDSDSDSDADGDTDSDGDADSDSDGDSDGDTEIDGEISPYIVVDQFGYRPDAEKIAVIRNPQVGYDAEKSFTPGATYALVDVSSGEQAATGAPIQWNAGATDESSGDAAWWFDFSSTTAPGTYYVLDMEKNVRSAVFKISDTVYRQVLRQAVRTFFYQRAGQDKSALFAGEGWADSASHMGPLQDANCRVYNDAENPSTERDLSGGWYDAGDYNKYTNWTTRYIIQLLRAFEENPKAFTDDYNIPESGNGIPDIVDEAKWGVDHLVRLQNPNGSVLSIVGLAHGSPPSTASEPSLYGTENTSSALSTAGALAYASKIFSLEPAWGLADYSADLLIRAQNAWHWADANPNVLFYNNDADHGTAGLGAGQQEQDDYGRLTLKIAAAVYLLEATGDTVYRNFVDSNYEATHLMEMNFVFPFQQANQDMLLYYANLADATPAVADSIRTTYSESLKNDEHNLPAFTDNVDPYGAHLDQYTWGSNCQKSNMGLIFMANNTYDLDVALNGDTRRAAERYIHYIHGVNPQGIVYLSNMYKFGGDKCVNEFFHGWFTDGSLLWDRVGESTYGPPPGYLTGGPNPNYNCAACCDTNSCGSDANNANCTSISIDPPRNQPKQILSGFQHLLAA